MPDIQQQKSDLRGIARKRRATRCVAGNIGSALCEMLSQCDGLRISADTTVSGYMPMPEEADVIPLLEMAQDTGAAVALPVTPKRGYPLTFRRWRRGDEMAAGPFGILEPTPAAPAVVPDILIVPQLAFDRAGFRLGYGGGYYDRTLLALRREKPILAVGVAFAVQEVDSVPRNETDARLDWVLTESEAIKVNTV